MGQVHHPTTTPPDERREDEMVMNPIFPFPDRKVLLGMEMNYACFHE